MIVAGRFITGMSMGAFCVAAPMYTSEIAEIEIRGSLGTFFQLFLTVGTLYAQIMGLFGPKICTYACMIVPIIFFVLVLFQPETPVFSIKKGNNTKESCHYFYFKSKYYVGN